MLDASKKGVKLGEIDYAYAADEDKKVRPDGYSDLPEWWSVSMGTRDLG
jgi:hypothetical protein